MELVVSSFLLGATMLIAVFQTAMTTEMVPPRLLGTWLSVLAIFDGVVGLVIAPALGGLIWDVISPVHVISLMIGITIAAVPLFFLIPETLRKQESQRQQLSISP
jgi:MFS family permease